MRQSIKIKDYLTAYNILIELLNKNIINSDVLYLIGEVCFMINHYEISKNYFIQSLQYEYNLIKSLYYLGEIAFIEKDYEGCLEYLLKYVENDCDSIIASKAFYFIAFSYYKKEEIPEAFKYISLSWELDVKNKKIVELREFIFNRL